MRRGGAKGSIPSRTVMPSIVTGARRIAYRYYRVLDRCRMVRVGMGHERQSYMCISRERVLWAEPQYALKHVLRQAGGL